MVSSSDILEFLDRRKNVLLVGPPGTGKSRLMNEVAELFRTGGTRLARPSLVPGASVPIPAAAGPSGLSLAMLNRAHRKVFRTTLHQNSKYRDFLTGIVPELGPAGGYRVHEGILYQANEFAMQKDSAALLIIDELNRGPAIEVFGGSIVAIEGDKRLTEDRTEGPSTQFFSLLDPADGRITEYAFSPDLYILAAMNQADASVAPLDVAFLRRWQTCPLLPDYAVLYSHFGVTPAQSLPEDCTAPEDVYLAAIRALETLNSLICIGRGSEYQLGQGVLLSSAPRGAGLADALQFACEIWSTIYAHIEELFFGDCVSLAYLLNADSPLSPYQLEERYFAGENKQVLTCDSIGPDNIYALLRAIVERAP